MTYAQKIQYSKHKLINSNFSIKISEKFICQVLYIWIAVTKYVKSAFSGPPVFSGPNTCKSVKRHFYHSTQNMMIQ